MKVSKKISRQHKKIGIPKMLFVLNIDKDNIFFFRNMLDNMNRYFKSNNSFSRSDLASSIGFYCVKDKSAVCEMLGT